MVKKHTITITKPEAFDILCLIETNKKRRLVRRSERLLGKTSCQCRRTIK